MSSTTRLTVFGAVSPSSIEGEGRNEVDIENKVSILYSNNEGNGLDTNTTTNDSNNKKMEMGDEKDVSLQRLKELGVDFNYFFHDEAHTIDEYRPHCEKHCPEGRVCKNLFCKDKKKKKEMVLIVALAETDVSISVVQNFLKLKNLRMASADTLKATMGLKGGAVTPLGLINDTEQLVNVFLDKDMVDAGETHPLCVHPTAGNHCTITIKTDALTTYITSTQHQYYVVDFATGNITGPF
eukprot:m.4693 g.4693  ORF g.4693 m.4693 type:complete len:239 (-) comp3959_c1_seq1:237-953(-)